MRLFIALAGISFLEPTSSFDEGDFHDKAWK